MIAWWITSPLKRGRCNGFFGLAAIEQELIGCDKRSGMIDVLEDAMLGNPQYWNHHYQGNERAQHILRRYSYSDRVRYYWTDPKVQQAVAKLMENIDSAQIPETMLSQYLPEQYLAMRSGTVLSCAEELLLHKVRTALAPYADACRV